MLYCMNTASILQAIDDEIARLSRARALLTTAEGKPIHKPFAGNKTRKLSPAARKKIAAAMRARWAAARKKASPSIKPPKKTAGR